MRFGSLHPYVDWPVQAHPLNWDEQFGRSAPLKVEIGFGNGEHLVRQALDDPDSNYVGLEITWGSIWRALRTTHRRNANNLRLILGDAKTTVAWNFASQSVDDFLALFPCPWPKKRHAKYRLFQPDFLLLCNSRLKPGGALTVVTDSAPYRDQMLEEITLEGTGMSPTCEVIPATFDTKYERKWQDGGQQEFYRLTFKKTEHRALENPETIEMNPHTVDRFDPENFAPQDQHGQVSINFKQFLYDAQRETALQEVFATEETISQQFWVRIKKLKKGWKISTAAGPNLVPVPSVQKSLDLIRDACLGVATGE